MKKILQLRNEGCSDCKLSKHTHQEVCQMGFGPKGAEVVVISKMPNSNRYQKLIETELESAGLDPSKIFYTAALKCSTFDVNASRGDVKACAKYLKAELDLIQPKWILLFGNEPLQALTNHSGITKYRGKILTYQGASVIPTVSPAATQRNPGQAASWRADIQFFANQVRGVASTVVEPRIQVIDTKAKIDKLIDLLKKATLLSYDVETIGFDEFKPQTGICSLAGTITLEGGGRVTWALPLYHPESPFLTNWKKVLRKLAPYLEAVPKQVAHNGKFDARWMRHYGVRTGVTFDTMLAAHILDENRQKGLKPQATSRFGVADWGIETKDLWNEPIDNILPYNGLDTFYTYLLYKEMRQELIENPRLLRVFRYITTPANEELIDAERRGVWIDREKLATNTKIAFDMRDEIDRQLLEFVPHHKKVDWPKNSKGKEIEVNWNASNFARWFLFEHLGLPVIRRGKDTDDGDEGKPSMAEDVMLELKGQHPVIELLLKRSKWQKYCSSFLTAYDELLDENDRIHTTYKLSGTVTGRLSSGKVDADKVSSRAPVRGVNLQQVPRDPFIRGLFGSAPGYAFVEADFSQVELRVVAFISRDPTMLHLYNTGQDIHRATAAWVLGKPSDEVTSDDRKKAKAVNFGFVYGMGAPKFVATAFEKYEVVFTLDEAKEIRRAFFERFSGLMRWHARQRRLVNEYARVQSPLGRIRHLPDINSEEEGVRAEAERQAINSPVQSFASDMTMLSMVLINKKFRKQGIEGYCIGTVHDALLYEVKEEDVGRALPIIKDTMENLPLDKYFGTILDVPIVSDLKIGRYWGGARELEPAEVYNWTGNIDQ